MTRQVVLRQPGSMVDRRQPLLQNSDYSSRGCLRKVRLAEVAGGTTAECAAVCCCCPCGLVNLLVLAVYKVPAGLCRKGRKRLRRALDSLNNKRQGAVSVSSEASPMPKSVR